MSTQYGLDNYYFGMPLLEVSSVPVATVNGPIWDATKQMLHSSVRDFVYGGPMAAPGSSAPQYIKDSIQPSAKQAVNYLQVTKLLKKSGLTSPVLDWAYAQAGYETANFTHAPALADNNLSGISWINKPYQNATRGRKRPAKEGGYYAHYNSLQDWATDFVRILNLGAKPVNATSLEDYVNRLGANNYFDVRKPKAKQNYLHGMQNILTMHPASAKALDEAQADVKVQQYKQPNWWDEIPTSLKFGSGILLAVVTINALKR